MRLGHTKRLRELPLDGGSRIRLLAVVLSLASPATALAHARGGEALGFSSGLLHPVSGVDHVVAMIVVGLRGAQLGAPAVWLLPVTFPIGFVVATGSLHAVGIATGLVHRWPAGRAAPRARHRRPRRRGLPLARNRVRRQPMMVRRQPTLALGFGVVLAAARPADAHLMNTGFGPFSDGLTQLFVTPEDLLPVVALALLAGLRGARFGCAVLFALPSAWLAGSWIAAIGLFMLGWSIRGGA